MDKDKRKRLEANGWKVTTATEFLELTPAEEATPPSTDLITEKSNLKFATSTEQRKNKRQKITSKLSNLGEILVDDIEKASDEIAETFKKSINR